MSDLMHDVSGSSIACAAGKSTPRQKSAIVKLSPAGDEVAAVQMRVEDCHWNARSMRARA
jgi:hypothetical protein